MSRLRDWLAVLGLCVVVGALAYLAGRSGRVEPTPARVDTLLVERALVDTEYVADTLALAMWRARYEALRRQLARVDTVRDTVEAPGAPILITEVLAAADSTITYCTAALRDCDRIRALDDSVIRILRASPIPRDRRWGVWVGAGPSVAPDGRVRLSASVGVGVRLWPR